MKTPDEGPLEALHSIESAFARLPSEEPDLTDLDILDAIETLVRRYGAEENGRTIRDARLAERPARVLSALLETCEQILGRTNGAPNGSGAHPPLADLLACLRRLQSSVHHWNRQGGGRAYLEFISDYVA